MSVFEFNSQKYPNLLPVAQNALRRLRVTRHPDILKFMDAVEADGTIYIMTERVKPLSAELPSLEATSVKAKQDWILWGLHRMTVRFDQSEWKHTQLNASSRSHPNYLECPFLHPHLMQRCSQHCSHQLDIYFFHWRMETRRV